MFAKEAFSSVVEKAGPSKVFWPARAASHTKAAAQAQRSQQTRAQPSYAYNYRNSYELPTLMNPIVAPYHSSIYNNPSLRGQAYSRPAPRHPMPQANPRPSRQRPVRGNFRGQDQYPSTSQGPGRSTG